MKKELFGLCEVYDIADETFKPPYISSGDYEVKDQIYEEADKMFLSKH